MNSVTWKSPLGTIHLAASESGLSALAFAENWNEVKAKLPPLENRSHKILERAIEQLEEYFAGKRKSFSLPLDLQGTPFQQSAWEALRLIPYGRTATYSEQAVAMRNPKAVRAVGAANGRNPVCIVVPCHRVVGADGSLTGYAGGLGVKKALLELESGR